MTGFITKKRYKYATVYVDQASGLAYVYMQKTSSAEEILESKRAFENHAGTCGVIVEAYHTDSGTFKAHAWGDECRRSRQALTFAGVGAHHANGKAESAYANYKT